MESQRGFRITGIQEMASQGIDRKIIVFVLSLGRYVQHLLFVVHMTQKAYLIPPDMMDVRSRSRSPTQTSQFEVWLRAARRVIRGIDWSGISWNKAQTNPNETVFSKVSSLGSYMYKSTKCRIIYIYISSVVSFVHGFTRPPKACPRRGHTNWSNHGT